MTIGWAIIIVAVLYLLEKHGLFKKALIVSGITLAVAVVGYGIFISCVLIKNKWDKHHKPIDYDTLAAQNGGSSGTPIPPPPDGSGIAPNAMLGIGTVYVSYGKASTTMLIPVSPPLPPPSPDGGDWTPMISGNEFAFKRLGSKEYIKAICYNETTKQISSVMFFDDKTSSCAEGILMEEVK